LLPLAVLAVGRRAAAGTALDAAAAAAGVRLDAPAVVRQGIVVVLTDDAALRVALGPARGQIDAATAALELLRTLSPPPEVSERVPWLLADGETGLVRWSLERRLAGTKPGPLPLADCRAFLLALFHVGGDASAHRPDQNADVVAAACPDIADPIRDVAARAEESTASLARGFGHGDFWSDNLLVENGRLTGVVDWDAAGPGRLPLLDLLHLRANACRRRSLGVAIARDLLPWARRGGDDETRDFCAELGFATTPRLLEALVVAYWLDYVAYQLRLYADRSSRTQWLHANVVTVLDALQDADGRR
jgi:hypothetical protein